MRTDEALILQLQARDAERALPDRETGKGMIARSIVAVASTAVLLLAAGLLAFGFAPGMPFGGAAHEDSGTIRLALPFAPEKLATSDPDLLKPFTPGEALAANLARPVSTLPNPAARPMFVPVAQVESYGRALDCMTAAVYYEAAFESLDGRRAVAQVILNRTRHAAYPHSVCGVVFQGSERRTGCQFTFTCDGSLARVPDPAVWTRAREVAAAALAGFVYSPVGLATHYHADYVVPYWAGALVKLSVVGRHIFYRFDRGYGAPAAFRQAYASEEPRKFDFAPSGRLVLHQESGEAPVALALGEALLPTARPILDTTGKAIAEGGKPLAEPQPAKLAAEPAERRPAAGGRWIIEMDGARNVPIRQTSLDPPQVN